MSLPKAFEELNTPSMASRRASKYVAKYIKGLFTISAFVLTYFVSNKLGILLQTMNLDLLQRIINLILVGSVAILISKK